VEFKTESKGVCQGGLGVQLLIWGGGRRWEVRGAGGGEVWGPGDGGWGDRKREIGIR
jgi:hypothetical protein